MNQPLVTPFFDDSSNTFSYVVQDPQSSSCAIIDSVLDFDFAAGRTSTHSASKILDFVLENALTVEWVLETHVHADHLSAAPWLAKETNAKLGIGNRIIEVQEIFGKVFNSGTEFERDGSQFDALFEDDTEFRIGSLDVRVIHTPGHTPACVTYVIGDAAFVGDTLFMPDFGSARCDFPGGDPRVLYQSAQRILSLPDETRIFVCHDYATSTRSKVAYITSVEEQKAKNIHVGGEADEDSFVTMRTERDNKLSMPKLIIPAVQVNMRAGRMPPASSDGNVYLKVPLNVL
ncbi:MBL fold metallo-hydrolase [Idiomarina sp. MD25a]|uniref:MBL fold metallo-hydrolase n=1 Tax=Idiomarina sp. MD25a TaxID=1889913 RepID=UPI0008F8BA87|nr:MBL fold metallo-hydrolase [Idiomarina sp. MD25a]OIM99460.1 MBL fold metallo-hydrolase [Idiomarina sp. MD25a]